MTDRAPHLGYTILYVRDVAKSLDFYERAFALQRRFLHESGSYGELETGATALAFAAEETTPVAGAFTPTRPDGRPPGAEVGLVVADVAAAYQRALRAGAHPVLKPTEKPWGQTVAYVRDHDGFLVELCTPVG